MKDYSLPPTTQSINHNYDTTQEGKSAPALASYHESALKPGTQTKIAQAVV